jgi:hypothetical protein
MSVMRLRRLGVFLKHLDGAAPRGTVRRGDPRLLAAFCQLWPDWRDAAEALGIDLNRLHQYRRRERPIPGRLQRAMRDAILVHLFGSEDGSHLGAWLDPEEAV